MSTHRQVGFSADGQQYLLSINGGAPIPLESLSITETERAGSGLFKPPREIQVEVTTQSDALSPVWSMITGATIDTLHNQVADLRSWLSGVQPVEDPDVPGRFYCGCCGHVLPAHLHGCPVPESPASGSSRGE